MKFAVIGWGQFDGAIAKTLAMRGIETLVIDMDEQLMGEISYYFASAVAMDASDRKGIVLTRHELYTRYRYPDGRLMIG